MKLLKQLLSLIWECQHGKTTWPRTRAEKTFVTCLECGKELPYSIEHMRRIA